MIFVRAWILEKHVKHLFFDVLAYPGIMNFMDNSFKKRLKVMLEKVSVWEDFLMHLGMHLGSILDCFGCHLGSKIDVFFYISCGWFVHAFLSDFGPGFGTYFWGGPTSGGTFWNKVCITTRLTRTYPTSSHACSPSLVFWLVACGASACVFRFSHRS